MGAQPVISKVFCITVTCLLLFSCSGQQELFRLKVKDYPGRVDDFSLWQLEQFNGESQMGYLIRTDDNQLILIDGGTPRSSVYIEDYINQFGGVVHKWIITHPHNDHMGVLMKILEGKKVDIVQIIHTAVDLEMVRKHEPQSLDLITRFYQILDQSAAEVLDLETDASLNLGEGVVLEVLGATNNNIAVNYVNNSSLVFKIKSKNKKILFTGDLGVEGGNVILKRTSSTELYADYVQMAHHGQDGVSKEFYTTLAPQYALWPTPIWLWENNLDGKGLNTGNWKTLEVRDWMNELNIKRNYVSGVEGTVQID